MRLMEAKLQRFRGKLHEDEQECFTKDTMFMTRIIAVSRLYERLCNENVYFGQELQLREWDGCDILSHPNDCRAWFC